MPGPTNNVPELKGSLPPDQEKVALETEWLDQELNELKARFDQFFLGIERKNPERQAQALRERLAKLKGAFIRNTALKFRIQSLYQKLLSYERLWHRTLKEVEEGTYRRDIFRLRHKNELKKLDSRTKEAARPAAAESAKFESFEDFRDLEAGVPSSLREEPLAADRQPPKAAPALTARLATGLPAPIQRQPSRGAPSPAPTVPAAEAPLPRQATGLVARQPSPIQASTGSIPVPVRSRPAVRPGPDVAGASDGPALGDDQVRAIYEAYISAKRRCRESTEGLTFESVARSLRKQVPALLKQKGITAVDFKVVIKDGRAVLKAVRK